MADCAVGALHGVAKKADLTAVQLDDMDDPRVHLAMFARHINALDFIINDIQRKGIAGKAVVIMSWSLSGPMAAAGTNYLRDDFFRRLTILVQLGVGLVTGPVNGRKNGGDVPGIFADPNSAQYLPSLMFVQSGDINDGAFVFPEDQRDNFATTFAPGRDKALDPSKPGEYLGLFCVGPTGDDRSEARGGNSMAAAFTGGLMAYFMGRGQTASQARQTIIDYSYSRKTDGPQMSWNGISISDGKAG